MEGTLRLHSGLCVSRGASYRTGSRLEAPHCSDEDVKYIRLSLTEPSDDCLPLAFRSLRIYRAPHSTLLIILVKEI